MEDGIDCSLNDGALSCTSDSSQDVDTLGTKLHYDQVYSGTIESSEALVLHRVSEIDCEPAPDNEDSCAAYFADTVFPCIWDFSSSFER